MPIQLIFSNSIWPFFAKVAPLLLWFLQPWLSTTNDFYRNYQELGWAENNFGGAFAPLPSPGAATGRNRNFLTCFLLGQFPVAKFIYARILFYEDNRNQFSWFLFPQVGINRPCELAGIFIPASAQRHSPPDNYSQQLFPVKTVLRFFSVSEPSVYILCDVMLIKEVM